MSCKAPKDFGSHPPDSANYASSQKEVARASCLRCSESVRGLGEFREKVAASYKENDEITLPFTTSRFAMPKSTQFPPAILRDDRQRLKYSRLVIENLPTSSAQYPELAFQSCQRCPRYASRHCARPPGRLCLLHFPLCRRLACTMQAQNLVALKRQQFNATRACISNYVAFLRRAT